MMGCQVELKEFEPDIYTWRPELLVTDLTCEAFNEPLIRPQFKSLTKLKIPIRPPFRLPVPRPAFEVGVLLRRCMAYQVSHEDFRCGDHINCAPY
jgi:hypothetical protein